MVQKTAFFMDSETPFQPPKLPTLYHGDRARITVIQTQKTASRSSRSIWTTDSVFRARKISCRGFEGGWRELSPVALIEVSYQLSLSILNGRSLF